MITIVCDDYKQMSINAYSYIKDTIINNSNAVLGLATGSTPIGLYNSMIEGYNKGELSYKNVKTINLDEYIGLRNTQFIDDTLKFSDKNSYKYYMYNNLFKHIDIKLSNTHIPDYNAQDMAAECERYNALYNSLIPDIQVLGIGSNGHIGFNEPYTPFDAETHMIKLADSTKADNARFFLSYSDIPSYAITLGIKNILSAKKIILLASGENKSDALFKMFYEPKSTANPASALMGRDNVIAIIDKTAAKKLNL